MKKDKRRAAEYLLDEFGLIDDNLIEAAVKYERPRRLPSRNFIAIAAACCIIALVVLVRLPGLFSTKNEPDGYTDRSLAGRLREVTSENGDVLSTEEVDLFDGRPKIIWRYENDDEFNVLTITEGEHKLLISKIGSGSRVGEGTNAELLFWISDGGGSVVSPYLLFSAGNIGSELFDYSPEIEPTEGFVESVVDLIVD